MKMLYVIFSGVILIQWSYAMFVIWYFLIDSTYKTNKYRLPLLDFVGVTPTGMTFSVSFAYLEGENLNNVVWALERIRGLFLIRDAFPRVIFTNRDLALMNVVKIVFLSVPTCCVGFTLTRMSRQSVNPWLVKKMHGIMWWMPRGVWLIVLLRISSTIFLRSLKLLVHHGQCLLTMTTKHG